MRLRYRKGAELVMDEVIVRRIRACIAELKRRRSPVNLDDIGQLMIEYALGEHDTIFHDPHAGHTVEKQDGLS